MHKQLVVIGASAGGIETLRDLVRALPAAFPAPIAVVMHTSPQSPGLLHEILDRAGPLPAVNAENGMRLEPGRIYVAPPDYHLLVEPGRLRVTKGPRENRFRPAIDPLFRSAAQVYGPGAVGVILSGNLDDGTTGLWTIKQLGGIAIVQDPADALFPSMPAHAQHHVNVDHVVPLAQLAPLLVRVTARDVEPPIAVPLPLLDLEIRIAKEEAPLDAGVVQMSQPSKFACPECHGVLMQLTDAERVRFRCHTGHAYSAESLLAEIAESVERVLWNAIRAMQEGSMLMRELSAHALAAHPQEDTRKLAQRAEELKRQADVLRDMVTSTEVGPAH